MKRETALRMTGIQQARLLSHLLPSDRLEAVAIGLCGHGAGPRRDTFLLQRLELVPYEICQRRRDQIIWPSEFLLPLLDEARTSGLWVVKFHSHPGGFDRFSIQDEAADRSLFPFVYEWTSETARHASVVLLPDGSMFGRTVGRDGGLAPLATIAAVGDDIAVWHGTGAHSETPEHARRHAQLFGSETVSRLQKLRVAVIGCSGTGSIVISQLAHLGIGKLLLVDPDHLEEKNLNRIIGATMADARNAALKVEVMKRYVDALGLGTGVSTFASDLATPEAIRAVAECDVCFGCMDGVEGRHLLNRLASFYLLPYFDLGVRLEADGLGGVDVVCGTVHYLKPGGASLLSRRVYDIEEVRAAGLKRTDPAAYEEQLRSKYILGVREDRPAVISVNMQIASMAVNEFLARIHPYRHDANHNFATSRVSLKHGEAFTEAEGEPCRLLFRHTGRGDVTPLLDRPDLSE